eukprot:203200_1
MSSCTRVYHLPFGSQIEYAWEVRTNGSDWQRCIPFYFSIHYTTQNTSIGGCRVSLHGPKPWPSIHIDLDSLFRIRICAMDTNAWLPSYAVTTCTHQIDRLSPRTSSIAGIKLMEKIRAPDGHRRRS